MKTEFTLHFKFNPQTPPVSKERNQALLIGLMGGEQEHFYINGLNSGINPETLSHYFAAKPQIKRETDIKLIFNFLKEEGERNAYDMIISLFLSENNEKKREENISKRFMGISKFIIYCRNLNNFLTYCKQHTTIDVTHEDLQRGLLAWDLGRLVLLARIAYGSGLISENEAWEYIEYAGKKCREHFINWQEIGISFLLGQVINYPKEEDLEKAIKYFLLVTEDTESPWQKNRFD